MDYNEEQIEGLKKGFRNWAENMVTQLRNNYESQKVFPMGFPGPYPGYQYENAKNRGKGGHAWVSTGESFRNIFARVYNGANGEIEKVIVFFRYYLMFADMGVGKGTKYAQVDNAQKAHWGRLYKKWGNVAYTKGGQKKSTGQTARRSRPHLLMEIRHQVTRLELMTTEYYSRLGVENLYRYIYNIDESNAFG